nr:MAG TPA: hypothetical protein [Caudoviricetes sp.]
MNGRGLVRDRKSLQQRRPRPAAETQKVRSVAPA